MNYPPSRDERSVLENVSIQGRVWATNRSDSIVVGCSFEPALTARQPWWMPRTVANHLRRLVTEPTYPLLNLTGTGREHE